MENKPSGMKKDIIAGNKLIAEFMGMKAYHDPEINWYLVPDGYSTHLTHNWSEPLFHSSWDWLMPVIDDIYYSRRFPTSAQTMEVSSKPYKLYYAVRVALENLSIEQTWLAIVQFIKWYNTKTP